MLIVHRFDENKADLYENTTVVLNSINLTGAESLEVDFKLSTNASPKAGTATVSASGKYQKANDINTTLSATATASGVNVTLSTYANFAVVDSEGSVAAGEAPSLKAGFYNPGTTGSVPMLTYSGKTASKVSITPGGAAAPAGPPPPRPPCQCWRCRSWRPGSRRCAAP